MAERALVHGQGIIDKSAIGPSSHNPRSPSRKYFKIPEIIYSAIFRHLMLDNASHLITSEFLTSIGSHDGSISGQQSCIKVKRSELYRMITSLNAAPYTGLHTHSIDNVDHCQSI